MCSGECLINSCFMGVESPVQLASEAEYFSYNVSNYYLTFSLWRSPIF